jgi:hypothetical protein
MSVVSTWVAFLGFGVALFLVGMVWTRKEKRDHSRSSRNPHQNE